MFSNLSSVHELGKGGQGEVFRVKTETGADAVLKVFGPNTEPLRVDREIQKLRRIDSPYLVKMLGHGVTTIRAASCKYTLLEFVDGIPLSALSPRIIPEVQVLRMLAHVSRAIEALWAVRVVHRDIKPDNIMRRPTGDFVLIDLGVARHLDETTVTQDGYTLGTRGYMSPEQAVARKALTFRSDLFALGVVAYELAEGRHPFQYQQQFVGLISPSKLSRVSDATGSLILRLLATSPHNRPQSCQDVYSNCPGV